MEWTPSSDQIPLLPIDVLGLSMLRRFTEEPGRAIHRNSFVRVNGRVTSLGPEYNRPAILDAVNEAWDWLYTNGLMVGAGGELRTPSGGLEGYRGISTKRRALTPRHDLLALPRSR